MQRIAFLFGALLLMSVAAFGDDAKDALADDNVAADAPVSADTASDAGVPASDAPAKADSASLGSQMEDIKHGLLDLKRDLAVLEEDLLYPASSQVAVFLSMDVGEFFALDSVTLKLNGKDVTHYLYTQKQADALFRGGVQRLFVGNVKQGQNQLTAFFTGRGPEGRDYKRATTVTFEKSFEPSYVELKISDSTAKYQPEFVATVSP
ncbi:MAG TPA: AraC family transcriptional regulator [Pseudomonadales bacterium]|nr:AraC family transcriptional regulator [Pseudomonadales bacterium]